MPHSLLCPTHRVRRGGLDGWESIASPTIEQVPQTVPNPQQPARASELPRQIPIGLAALQVSRKHVTAVVFHLVFNQLADVDGFSLERGERVLFAPKGLPAGNTRKSSHKS